MFLFSSTELGTNHIGPSVAEGLSTERGIHAVLVQNEPGVWSG
jgi:hypothetical protein